MDIWVDIVYLLDSQKESFSLVKISTLGLVRSRRQVMVHTLICKLCNTKVGCRGHCAAIPAIAFFVDTMSP